MVTVIALKVAPVTAAAPVAAAITVSAARMAATIRAASANLTCFPKAEACQISTKCCNTKNCLNIFVVVAFHVRPFMIF